jgi:hypothetical protein
MAVDSPVKWFHSGQPNAPQTALTAAGLVGVLDGCLVDGFGLTNVTSITVAAGVATVVCASQHSFTYDGQVALVAGVSDKTALNGEQRVTQIVSSVSFRFATTAPDGAAGGAMTQKVAPLGWQTLFTGANKRAYKPTAAQATGGILRLDDSALFDNMARVNAFMAMTDVDTGTQGFPDLGTTLGWPHVNGHWIVIGDDKGFYWLNRESASAGYFCAWFGDIESDRPADAYKALLTGATGNPMYYSGSSGSCLMCIDEKPFNSQIGYMARAVFQMGGAAPAYRAVPGFWANGIWFAGAGAIAWPDPANNSLRLSRMLVLNNNPVTIRGVLPGMCPPVNSIGHGLQTINDRIPGQGALTGRTLMPVRAGSYSGSYYFGLNFFDITGPWR